LLPNLAGAFANWSGRLRRQFCQIFPNPPIYEPISGKQKRNRISDGRFSKRLQRNGMRVMQND
jgi:hypothetical protein